MKKQYILSSTRRGLSGLAEYAVGSGWLYVHPELSCRFAQTKNGIQVCLLGNAYCMDAVGKTPLDDIADCDGENLQQLTAFWTGRWVLLTEAYLVTDAGGLLSAFYRQSDDGWIVSSSLALLCRLTGQPVARQVPQSGLTWQLLPDTRGAGIKQLLCTQKLCMDQTIRPEHYCWVTDQRNLSGEEKCSRLAELLVNGVSNISRYAGKRIVLALTGGKDSRLVLAALLKAQVPFVSYTAAHSNISSADRRIPPILAKRFGFLHCYIQKKQFQQSLLEAYDRFTGGNSNGADRMFFACGQFSRFGKDTLLLRSGMFEAGQRYGRTYLRSEAETIESDLRRYYPELTTDPAQENSLKQWLSNARQHPIAWIDIRDRFYMEQRVGGWAAAIEQSLDINDFLSVQIANCAAVYSVLLSATEEERSAGVMSYDTIRLLEPALLDYDINKQTMSDKFRFILSVLKNPVKKLRAYLSRKGRR